MTTWDKDLLGIHRDVAADPSPLMHVLAGPGTGKTFAMMRRVARLLEGGTDPRRILAVSFTRTAARDLQEQLGALGIAGASDVNAATLHSFCFRILGSEKAFAFTKRSPRPLMSFEIACLEADLADHFGGKRKTRALLAAYEAAWARLQHEVPGYAKGQLDQEFENELLAWLRVHEAMLIGELVPLTLSFLEANPALDVIPPLEHVLVDEYQDLNKADQSLIKLFANAASLLVIGDDNQSIYSFRHANPGGIRTFCEELPATRSYTIEDCRRCPPNIVEMSNALISHDSHTSRPKPLKPDLTRPPADVWIVQHETLDAEVETTADFIDNYLKIHPDTTAGRILVLTPRRFIGHRIKDALIARGRNALSYFQEDAVESPEAAEGFCLLTLLVRRDDRAALRAWLGFGAPDHRQGAVNRVREYCDSTGTTFPSALQGLAKGTIKIAYTAAIIDRWNELQTRLLAVGGLQGLALVDALWPSRGEDVLDVRLLAQRIALQRPEPAQLLEDLWSDITQPELPGSEGDVIQVMSLHKSKGLTRDVVVVAGCMAGTLPFVDTEDPPELQHARLEEQRRLFYVAVTRATKVLVISAAARVPLQLALSGGAAVVKTEWIGDARFAVTSFTPFLSELGPSAPKVVTGEAWRAKIGI